MEQIHSGHVGDMKNYICVCVDIACVISVAFVVLDAEKGDLGWLLSENAE